MTTKKAVDVGAIALRVTAHPAPPPQPHARPIKDATATGLRARTATARSAPARPVTARQGIARHAVTETVRLPRAVTGPPMATGQPAQRGIVPSVQDLREIVLREIARPVTARHAATATVHSHRVGIVPLMATGQPVPKATVPSVQDLLVIVLRETVRPVTVPMATARRAATATVRSPRVVTDPLTATVRHARTVIVPTHRVANVLLSGRARRAARA